MALDFSLLGQGPQFQNVLAAFEGGQKARKQTDTRNALSRYSTDPEGAISALSKVDPVMSMKLEGDYAAKKAAAQKRAVFQETDPAKQDALAAESGDPETQEKLMALRKGVIDMDAAKLKATSDANAAAASSYWRLFHTPKEQRVALYEQIKPALMAMGAPEIDPLDDNLLQAKIDQGQSVDKIISQQEAAEKAKRDAENLDRDNQRADLLAGNTIQHDRTMEANDKARLGYEGQRVGLERQRVGLEGQRVAQTANGGMTPVQARKTEADLRNRFDALPEVKNYRTVNQAARTVQEFANAPPSAQGDIAITYSTMKAYDPTSVVRETEFATAQNAAGVPDRIRNQWNKVLNGQRLTPKQRQEMANAVGTVAKSARGRFDEIEGQYRGYAEDYGVSPDRVAPKSAAGPAKTTRPPLSAIFGK